MTLFAGLFCIFSEPCVDTTDRIDQLVALLTDPRWPWQPQLMKIGNIAGGPLTPQVKGKIPRADLAAAVRSALAAPTASHVDLTCTKKSDTHNATIRIDTGRHASGWDKVPFEILACIDAEDPPPSKSVASWIELADDLVRAVRGVHAVIPVTRDRMVMGEELWLHVYTLNGRLVHPDPAEMQRIRKHRRELGTKWVRPPRWGNYLGAAAIAAAGGRARIEEVVQPAVIREVGALTYVQLSERVEDALAPATEAKRRALGELLASVVVPVKD